jgi:hypothetical protein
MTIRFSPLEQNILKAKGLTDDQLQKLDEVGIHAVPDFATVGDAATLAQLVGLTAEVAQTVMAWAAVAKVTAVPASGQPSGPTLVESADIVHCVHCKTRQPKDYQSGDLCPACGKQAEPILACFWCGTSGPGRFCRSCGAEFVPTGELELAVQLRRDGLPKNEIPGRLAAMTAAEKDALWGLVRRRVAR